jgi:hypothetical protein
MKVWKYPLKDYHTFVEMPVGAKILDVQIKDNLPCIWALVDETQELERREFRGYATGEKLDVDIRDLDYIGTFQLHIENEDFIFVFHLFEVRGYIPQEVDV